MIQSGLTGTPDEDYKQDREWLETLEHVTVGYHDVDWGREMENCAQTKTQIISSARNSDH